jgi:hypothetical protein
MIVDYPAAGDARYNTRVIATATSARLLSISARIVHLSMARF